MAHWRLKIERQFADEIIAGNKTFEIRQEDDKVFQRGDTVEFAIVPAGKKFYETKEIHDIHNRIYQITYVLHGWGIQEGYCIFGIREIQEDTAQSKEQVMVMPRKELEAQVIKLGARDIAKYCKQHRHCYDCCFCITSLDACMVNNPEQWFLEELEEGESE